MAGEMEALFNTIGGSKASSKSDNFRDGKGQVVIEELICNKMNGGNVFVARTKVVESASKGDRVPIFDPVKRETTGYGDLVVPNAKDSSVGWPQMLDKHKSAPGNVKGFTLSLLGFKEEQVTPEQFTEALSRLISKEQPARGMLINYETFQQTTRSGPNAGKTNTYVRWTHVSPAAGNDKDSIAKRRSELDVSNPA